MAPTSELNVGRQFAVQLGDCFRRIGSERTHIRIELDHIKPPQAVLDTGDVLLPLTQPLRQIGLQESALQAEADTVSNVSITGAGYFAPESNNTGHVYLAAWSGLNGTGSLLGSIEGPLCCGLNYGPSTVSLNVSGIQSVQFYDTNPAVNSLMVFDNLTVETGAVPEPATWALMIFGFGAVGAMMRRQRMPVMSSRERATT